MFDGITKEEEENWIKNVIVVIWLLTIAFGIGIYHKLNGPDNYDCLYCSLNLETIHQINSQEE